MNTKEKALKINLDPQIYGTFAEIGAGQEVARFFFRAGAASGTVAKTMSAYDMVVSDTIYGPEPNGRYVSETRLQTMLSREYELMVERLSGRRENPTCFFAFADTIATSSYQSNKPGRGWIGVRFQEHPHAAPSQLKIHIQLLSPQANVQQQTVGIVGVNLIYACFYLHSQPINMIQSLIEDVDTSLVKIDCIHASGPLFDDIDDRLLQLELLKCGLSDAAMIAPDGTTCPASEHLYKKHVLSVRGAFNPFSIRDVDRIRSGMEMFLKEPDIDPKRVRVICEIPSSEFEGHSSKNVLARFDMIASMSHYTMISKFERAFQLTEFYHMHSPLLRAMVMDRAYLQRMFTEQEQYKNLNGGFLQALGILLKGSTHLYTYPTVNKEGHLQCERLDVDPHDRHLLQYFQESGYLKPIFDYNEEAAKITAANVKDDYLAGDTKFVPEKVAAIAKQLNFNFE